MSARTRFFPLALAFVAAAIAAPSAAADGLPVPVDTSSSGVRPPSGGPAYFSIPTREGSTVIRMSEDGTEIERQRFFPLRNDKSLPLAIPAVAVDGTVGGLSADGRTLVLIEPRKRFPRATTRLVVLNSDRFDIAERITLEGDFSFDAISTNGSTLYLTHYLDRRDPTRYEVRAYDVSSGRLAAEPIVGSEIVEIQMRGLPLTRATSPDGSWEYTAYDGNYETPFVHALNVDSGHALCINLTDQLGRKALPPTLALTPGGGELIVTSRQGQQVASIETGGFEVTDLRASPAAPTPGDGDPSVAVVAIGAACLLVAMFIGRAVWRRRRSQPIPATLAELDFEPVSQSPRDLEAKSKI